MNQPYCEPDWHEPPAEPGITSDEAQNPDHYIEPETPQEWAQAHAGERYKRPRGRTVYTVTDKIEFIIRGRFKHIRVMCTRLDYDKWTGDPYRRTVGVPYRDIRYHMEKVS